MARGIISCCIQWTIRISIHIMREKCPSTSSSDERLRLHFTHYMMSGQ